MESNVGFKNVDVAVQHQLVVAHTIRTRSVQHCFVVLVAFQKIIKRDTVFARARALKNSLVTDGGISFNVDYLVYRTLFVEGMEPLEIDLIVNVLDLTRFMKHLRKNHLVSLHNTRSSHSFALTDSFAVLVLT